MCTWTVTLHFALEQVLVLSAAPLLVETTVMVICTYKKYIAAAINTWFLSLLMVCIWSQKYRKVYSWVLNCTVTIWIFCVVYSVFPMLCVLYEVYAILCLHVWHNVHLIYMWMAAAQLSILLAIWLLLDHPSKFWNKVWRRQKKHGALPVLQFNSKYFEIL